MAARSNRTVGLIALSGALAMLGLGYASVPLYQLFCQVTGFAGTTMRVSEAQAAEVQSTEAQISVRFDSNVAPSVPWRFAPSQVTQSLRIGERKMAFYTAENRSDRPVTGMATFNVEPELAGKYFNKIQCFCFNQQTLKAGEQVEMPVIYYVDPAILSDPDTRDIEQITLSYTFHLAADQPSKALDPAKSAR